MQLQARLGRGRAEGLRELSWGAAWDRGDQEMESEPGFAAPRLGPLARPHSFGAQGPLPPNRGGVPSCRYGLGTEGSHTKLSG